ncbi:hypothetical protein GCM10009555_029400 [Acrocarpospora macrocephala]|uniref:Peptidase inhibitor family I36 n=1 Tax=Acrocarpospora macrocephala TaxID=150177 RepID=A0A5M3WX57_9ACTN|nr:hypothetical protein [Acrocarpospora macrocephala]GES11153.1 hypothetical protein Amac_047500 [Acrocarpospora macrocephala]
MIRKLVATTAALLAGATLFVAPASAGAAAFDPNPTIGGNGQAVPAPHYATGARGVSAPSYLPSCPFQRVCIAVLDYQDNNINTWKIYDLYQCGDYSFYDWHARGWIRNNQSGGAVAVRLNSTWSVLSPTHPVDNRWLDVNWEPAYHFRPC